MELIDLLFYARSSGWVVDGVFCTIGFCLKNCYLTSVSEPAVASTSRKPRSQLAIMTIMCTSPACTLCDTHEISVATYKLTMRLVVQCKSPV